MTRCQSSIADDRGKRSKRVKLVEIWAGGVGYRKTLERAFALPPVICARNSSCRFRGKPCISHDGHTVRAYRPPTGFGPAVLVKNL